MNMQRFGEKLHALRKQQGLSQRQLADQLGLSESFTRDLEHSRKNPNARHLLKISRLFSVSIDVLLKDELDLNENDHQ